MKKLYTTALTLALASVFILSALAPVKGGTNDGPGAPLAIGATLSDFKLPDAAGKEHSLSSLRGKNGTVLIFISVQCPVSNAYNETMKKLAEDYKARGINVVGINANATEPAEEVKRHAAEKGLAFTILKDNGNKIADLLGARVTPEAYLLDASNKLVYHGRIDNANPRRGERPTSEDLRNAIEATLEGRAVEKTEALAFGCSIKRG